jgi:hypothetical protein
MDVTLDLPQGGLVKNAEVYLMNDQGQYVQIIGTRLDMAAGQLTFTAQGAAQTFYGKKMTNPGHHIYRLPNGQRWEHKGERTEPIQFIPDSSTFANGITRFPGVIPAPSSGKVFYRYTRQKVTSQIEYADLRYEYGITGTDGLPDMAPNWNMNGAAATHAYEAEPPDVFYESEEAVRIGKGFNILPAQIASETVTIYDARTNDQSHPESIGSEPYYWGPSRSHPGYGEVKVRRMLTGDLISGFDYEPTPDNDGGEDRNYFMSVDTYWSGISYKYAGYVEVEYDNAKPNLIAVSLVNTAPLELGTPVPIQFSFVNTGKKLDGKSLPFPVYIVEGLPDSYTRIVHRAMVDKPLDDGETYTGTFDYTFLQKGVTQLSLLVDPPPNHKVEETTKEDNNQTRSFTIIPDKPKGDFDIVPPEIHYRDPFELVPKNIDPGKGCTYEYHVFEFPAGSGWISPRQKNPSAPLTFTYPDYPPNLVVGANPVRMKVVSSCGESDWIEHDLTVTPGEEGGPPFFKAGFFREPNRTGVRPDFQVTEGEWVNLRIISDPDSDPPSPSDPDGDPVTYFWDFAGSPDPWIRELPQKYHFSPNQTFFGYIQADKAGHYAIKVTATDSTGQSFSRIVTLDVVAPNPVPRASCPAEWKANRAIPEGFINANLSFSPVPWRSIDHSRDVWTNKRSSYANDTDHDITVRVTLERVYDNTGLGSLTTSACSIVIHPDPPPVAKIKVPPVSLRNQTQYILNESYTTDGTAIRSIRYQYKYDGNNNGFADDAWNDLAGDLEKAAFTPKQVGKYLFYAEVTKDGGKTANTLYMEETEVTLDTVNRAPSVSFTVQGKSSRPEVTPPVSYSAAGILTNWPLYRVNESTPVPDKTKFWQAGGNWLTGQSGGADSPIGQEQYPIPYNRPLFNAIPAIGYYMGNVTDNGYGANRLSPWRAAASFDSRLSHPLIDPRDPSKFVTYSQTGVKPKFRANGQDFFYNHPNGGIYALNKNRLSPVVRSQTGSNSYMYAYMNGSPYDYVVDGGSYNPRTLNGHAATHMHIKTYEIADPYLYLARTIGYETYDDEWISVDFSDIAQYDIRTGREIKSTLDTGAEVPREIAQTFRTGNHLVVLSKPFPGRPVFYEYDENLNNVRKAELPADPTETKYWYPCTYGMKWVYSDMFRDSDGNFYYYQYPHCLDSNGNRNPNPLSRNVYVTKLNVDFSFAWRTYLSGELADSYYADLSGFQGYPDTAGAILSINSAGQTLRARTIVNAKAPGQVYGDFGIVIETLDLRTGQVLARNDAATEQSPEYYGTYSTMYHMDWDGSFLPGSGTVTAEGYVTRFSFKGGNNTDNPVYDGNGNRVGSIGAKYLPQTTYDQGYQVFGEYFGDGFYVSAFNPSDGYYGSMNMVISIAKGTPTTAPKITEPSPGQFVSTVEADGDTEYGWTIKFDQARANRYLAGFSFRMSDPRNRLAVETDGSTVYLTRYTNGSRLVLAQRAYGFADDTPYPMKIKITGTHVEVSVNAAPLLSVNAGGFAGTRFGPFSEKNGTAFSAIYTREIKPPSADWLTGYAILENGRAEVQYPEIVFADPENDPRYGGFRWSFVHNPKFLNNGGVSPLNGRTQTSPQLTFDRVGAYDITLRARDDPHPGYRDPSMVFDSYRMGAEPFLRKLIVHRRPAAQFTLWTQGDGTIGWNDTSYDPDRYDPATGACSAPDATGYNYCANRGILERRYSYITPGGQYVEGKLTRPAEAGAYTVYLQVRDEYGAWSEPAGQTITSNGGVPQNSKPAAQLTYPAGSPGSPTLVYTVRPTITWNQYDTPGTIFKGYHVKISDPAGTVVAESGEAGQWTSGHAAGWTVPTDLTRGARYQVQVRVSDGEVWSDWSNIGWMLVNSPPWATITSPNGPNKDNPAVIVDNLQPTITWTQEDRERQWFNHIHLDIADGRGSLVFTTGDLGQGVPQTNNSYRIPQELPTLRPLQAHMKVTDDGNLWSGWSNTVWFLLDRTPVAQMTAPAGTKANPTLMNPTPAVSFNEWDPDPANIFTRYRVQFLNETGTQVLHDSGEVSQRLDAQWGTMKYSVPADQPLPAGEKVQVRVRVYDGYVWSAWSAPAWLLVNRPPKAEFDWQPKPVWEGDRVTLISRSADPDRDPLSYAWTVLTPDGSRIGGNSEELEAVFSTAGDYTVTLTVSDAYASDRVTHTIRAQELTITGTVEHTPQWRERHERAGHEIVRDPKDFYSGEIFVVAAESSPAPVEQAEAWMRATGIGGRGIFLHAVLQSRDPTHFAGELFDEILLSPEEGLPEGIRQIYFRIRYRNGVVKETAVPVRIIGKAGGTFRVHRRQ